MTSCSAQNKNILFNILSAFSGVAYLTSPNQQICSADRCSHSYVLVIPEYVAKARAKSQSSMVLCMQSSEVLSSLPVGCLDPD